VVRASTEDDWLEHLALWLKQHQALATYHLAGTPNQIQACLAALPAGQVVAIRPLWDPPQWAQPSLSALTALTSLPLNDQTQLSSGSQLEQILQPLAQLRELFLTKCELQALPAALARCTQLTLLSLASNPPRIPVRQG
jgi:hypothetical protein